MGKIFYQKCQLYPVTYQSTHDAYSFVIRDDTVCVSPLS